MTTKNTASTTAGKNPAAATAVEASGAVIEKSATKLIEHPSVDNNPRAGTTSDMNRIDFNEPAGLTPPEETVEAELNK